MDYNLIRAVFVQKLNIYLRKTCTIVLFKVFSIWSYDFFPSFWKFVDSIPKELRRLGGQEWINPIFDTLFWCEPYSSEGVLHRPDQMVVRRGKAWAIRLLLSSNGLIVFGSIHKAPYSSFNCWFWDPSSLRKVRLKSKRTWS